MKNDSITKNKSKKLKNQTHSNENSILVEQLRSNDVSRGDKTNDFSSTDVRSGNLSAIAAISKKRTIRSSSVRNKKDENGGSSSTVVG